MIAILFIIYGIGAVLTAVLFGASNADTLDDLRIAELLFCMLAWPLLLLVAIGVAFAAGRK